jgi:hypothetical protein
MAGDGPAARLKRSGAWWLEANGNAICVSAARCTTEPSSASAPTTWPRGTRQGRHPEQIGSAPVGVTGSISALTRVSPAREHEERSAGALRVRCCHGRGTTTPISPTTNATGTQGRCRAPPTRRSERLQVLDEVGLLCGCQVQPEQLDVVVDDGEQIGGAPIVKIRGVLPESAQRRRPVPTGR